MERKDFLKISLLTSVGSILPVNLAQAFSFFEIMGIKDRINQMMNEPGNFGITLQDKVMQRCAGIAPQNRPYILNGVTDCWGYVRQVWNAILTDGSVHTEDFSNLTNSKRWISKNLIPVDDHVSSDWQSINWSVIKPGVPIATKQGHHWGGSWHGGMYAGLKNGQHSFWDCSSSGNGAYLRTVQQYNGFGYYYVPLNNLLAKGGGSTSNRIDCVGINRKGGSNKTEIHGLSASSNYADFNMHIATALHQTDNSWVFCMDSDGDFYAICRSGRPTTEVHVLSKYSNYQTFTVHSASGLHPTDSNWAFDVASNKDVFGINRVGASGKTEIHALSKSSGYSKFAIHTATGLHKTDGNWEFKVANNRDLVAINRQGGSNKTEVHILTASSNYQQFSLHTATGLHATNTNWDFALAPNNDLYAIAKTATGSGTTEIHALSAASNYKDFIIHTKTGLHQTDGNWIFIHGVGNSLLTFVPLPGQFNFLTNEPNYHGSKNNDNNF